jgi:hypothetical protein
MRLFGAEPRRGAHVRLSSSILGPFRLSRQGRWFRATGRLASRIHPPTSDQEAGLRTSALKRPVSRRHQIARGRFIVGATPYFNVSHPNCDTFNQISLTCQDFSEVFHLRRTCVVPVSELAPLRDVGQAVYEKRLERPVKEGGYDRCPKRSDRPEEEG